jgi:hypothetical protein
MASPTTFITTQLKLKVNQQKVRRRDRGSGSFWASASPAIGNPSGGSRPSGQLRINRGNAFPILPAGPVRRNRSFSLDGQLNCYFLKENRVPDRDSRSVQASLC